MIPIQNKVEVIKSKTSNFEINMDISQRQIHKLIPLLRDSLYSDKILAPIREYSTNAQDEHVKVQTPNRPIQVTIPNRFDPNFKIRDFGSGLTLDQMKNTYFIYLETTKDKSNDFNGMFGLVTLY